MCLYQVIHIDIIPHSRTIWRIIIIPEYVERISFPESNVEDIGEEIIRNTLRGFSDPPRWMGTDRVEIPEGRHAPPSMTRVVFEEFLDHELRCPIGIRRACRHIFLEWRYIIRTIHGSRR